MKAFFLVAALIIACASAQDQVPSFLLGTWEVSSTTCSASPSCLQSIAFSVANSALDATYTTTSSCGGESSTATLDNDVEVVDMNLTAGTTIDISEDVTISTNAAGVTSLIVNESGCQVTFTKTASIMKVATAIVAVIAAAFMLI